MEFVKKKYIFVIQAREGSTRLSQKILKPIYDKRNVLHFLMQNLEDKFSNIPKIIATGYSNDNINIINLCKSQDWNYYAGSEEDVLSRFINVGKDYEADYIVRICADNPFIQMNYITVLLNEMDSNADYISFSIKGVPAIKTHYGFFTELVKLEALTDAWGEASCGRFHKEHVTNYIYENEHKFKLNYLPLDLIKENIPLFLRLTMDTREDMDITKKILAYTKGETQNLTKILSYVNDNSDIRKKMKKIIEENQK